METNLGERLERAIFESQLTQSQLAEKAGVTQQSISYIIKNKLKESKLAPKLAYALGVDPSWLILGVGTFSKSSGYEIPIINCFVQLQKLLRDQQTTFIAPTLFTEDYLGKLAFAYQTELRQVAICGEKDTFSADEFLLIEPKSFQVINEPREGAYPIYEWRNRRLEY
ncbi:helix-turn-helix transcriptional regulator [Shewanella sp. 202IG2-18]|uniref:helix-turn-helix transcriptional regulator n=1 Tax=Parashewanella hymeniacidonis TaxID=2807618 RepID=UPI00195F4441|nr:helix-turn-helix transcriptional regulator [Parashewanella hymeniacidonis]MBM7073259.1 helix-turn-helix transcriptional regulator [Parashewanella hymeniacidonis]